MSFEKITQRKTIQIAPYYLGNVLAGIERQLNNKLMCFSETLNGIILTYDNIVIIGDVCHIIDDVPFICIDIEVDFLTLKFAKDAIINGVITKFRKSKIDLLVYNTFNAQVGMSEFVNNDNFKKAYLKIGQQISFEINQYQHYNNNKMVQIIGSLPKQSNIGIFDEKQNFISIMDIITGKVNNNNKNKNNNNRNVQTELAVDSKVTETKPKNKPIKLIRNDTAIKLEEENNTNNDNEKEKIKHKKSKKRSKERQGKKKKKSKKEKKDKKKKRKKLDDNNNEIRQKKRRKI